MMMMSTYSTTTILDYDGQNVVLSKKEEGMTDGEIISTTTLRSQSVMHTQVEEKKIVINYL